jgi:DNA polymerase-3 subunit delta
MVAIKSQEIETVLRRQDRGFAAYLVYGPDSGLVSERARTLAESGVDDASDPFQLVKLDGDVLAGDAPRLVDEAGTIGLFGSKRSIWVRPTSRNIASALEALLAAPDLAATVVIEAGDLAKSSPLRTLAERSPRVAAIPCYADDDRSIATLVEDRFKSAGLQADRETRNLVVSLLGGDRLASRAELDKLLLYVHGKDRVTEEDVDAVLSDVSALALDEVVDATFKGDGVATDHAARRLLAEGLHGSVLLGAALRQALTLLSHRAEIEAGRSVESVMETWRGLHFRRKAAVTAALRLWSGEQLIAAIRRLDAALLQTRQEAHMANAITSRTLLQVARSAKRTA